MQFRIALAPHQDKEYRAEVLRDIRGMSGGSRMGDAPEEATLDRTGLGHLKRELKLRKGKK